jgi:hypothetical protein
MLVEYYLPAVRTLLLNSLLHVTYAFPPCKAIFPALVREFDEDLFGETSHCLLRIFFTVYAVYSFMLAFILVLYLHPTKQKQLSQRNMCARAHYGT